MIRGWSNGTVWAHDGRLGGIWGRWWPYQANLFEVWLLKHVRFSAQDHCWAYYSLPTWSPGFMSLRFIRSGRLTSLRTIQCAMQTLDEIAGIFDLYAMVCSASNQRLTEPLMRRFGFERHAIRLPGSHFIKRYRDHL